jgi:hypothetical protein
MMSKRITPATKIYLSTTDYGVSSLTNNEEATDAAVLGGSTTNVVSNSSSSDRSSDEDNDVEPVFTKCRGRKKGSTDKAREDKDRQITAAKTEVTLKYIALREELPTGGILPKGTLT